MAHQTEAQFAVELKPFYDELLVEVGGQLVMPSTLTTCGVTRS